MIRPSWWTRWHEDVYGDPWAQGGVAMKTAELLNRILEIARNDRMTSPAKVEEIGRLIAPEGEWENPGLVTTLRKLCTDGRYSPTGRIDAIEDVIFDEDMHDCVWVPYDRDELEELEDGGNPGDADELEGSEGELQEEPAA